MDGDRFDHLSRSLAGRTSRRATLKRLGGGGLLAAFAGFGLSRKDTAAQNDTATCAVDLIANVRLGPSQDRNIGSDNNGELRGQLRFSLGDNGRLVDGKLLLPDNTEFEAVGQVAGPSVTVRISTPLGGTLVLVGAGEKALRSCSGAVDGLLTGPQPGDLGDWHATAKQTGNQPATQSPTNPPAQAPAPIATEPPQVINDTPTQASTEAPTETSTEAPTEVPTEIPTEAPTAVPTVACMGDSGGPCNPGTPCCTGTCQYTDLSHCAPGDLFCVPLFLFICQ